MHTFKDGELLTASTLNTAFGELDTAIKRQTGQITVGSGFTVQTNSIEKRLGIVTLTFRATSTTAITTSKSLEIGTLPAWAYPAAASGNLFIPVWAQGGIAVANIETSGRVYISAYSNMPNVYSQIAIAIAYAAQA